MNRNITAELDDIACKLERIDPRLALALDKISDQLEAAMRPLQPSDLEKLTPEDIKKKKVQVIIQSSDDKTVIAFMVEAGLKSDFLNLIKRGKNYWESTWNSVKDKATQSLIKGLNTAAKVKSFIAAHPELKVVVLAAIALGVLALPGIASADILEPERTTALAEKLNWYYSGGPGTGGEMISVKIPKGWAEEVVLKSLEGHGLADAHQVLGDVYTNLRNILLEKGNMLGLDKNSHSFNELVKLTTESLVRPINTLLDKFI